MILLEVNSYKCPNCGGTLIFDPEKQDFRCDYCLSRFTKEVLDTLNPETKDKSEKEVNENSQANVSDASLFKCPSCGAQVVTDSTTAADYCFYCHNHVVLEGRLDGKYLPDKIIPFRVSKENALKIFKDTVAKKKFIKKDFFLENQIEKLAGVYYPYWVTDCDCDVTMNATAHKLRVWRVGSIEYTETSVYNICKEGTIHLDDLVKKALRSANSKLIEGVQPFEEAQAESFDMKYLLGFQAQMRDIEKEEISSQMQESVSPICEQILRSSCQNNSIIGKPNITCKIERENSDYELFPVWVMTYDDKKQSQKHYFTINGQTGKVCGDFPVDCKKLALLSGGISLAVFAVMLIAGYFL